MMEILRNNVCQKIVYKVKYMAFLCIMICLIFFSGVKVFAVTQSEFDQKITNLRSKYPNYSVWNDSFDGGTQCFGFARLMGYEIFGSKPSTWNKSYNINEVKVGDIVRYGNTGKQGHSIFVTDVSGNTITFVDCNGNGNYSGGTKVRSCGIKWDNKVQKESSLFGYSFNYLLISPGIANSGNSTPDPTIVGTYWEKLSETTFRPVIVINNPETVKEVRFAVWSTGDQSDLKWYDANYNGAGGYFKDINFSDFTNKIYICHVYVYAYNGKVQSLEMERLDEYDYSKPSIKGVYWGTATDTTFRPVIEISNPTSVKNVRFAVWSTSDQSDLIWYDANYNGAGGYFKDINYSDLVSQHYFCHVYVYGNDGSTQAIALNDFDTYDAEGSFESATGGIGCVAIRGFAFDRSNKKENVYIHCYAKDSDGNATLLGVTLANLERPDVDNVYAVGSNHGFSCSFVTSLSGTYRIEASAINIGGGKEVTFLGAKTVTITQPTVYFNSCGGSECDPVKVDNMQKYGSLPTATRPGYIFDGWYTEVEGGEKITEEDEVLLTDNQTLYAHWIKDNVPELSVSQKDEKLIAVISNTDSVIGYGFVYGKEEGVTLDTPGRIRVAFTELDEKNSFIYDISGLAEHTYRAYVIYADENGNEKIKYSERIYE